MPVTTIVNQNDPSPNEQQRKLSELVVASFTLPPLPLLIFLDDEVCTEIRNAIGPENRGLFTPTNARTFGELPWPLYVAQEIRKNSGPYTFEFPFTGIVYVHGDVCDNEHALVMTLAHELQHFVQYSTAQPIWAWNHILMRCGTLIASEGLSWCDIPTEVEARIVAKRIHQDIFGMQNTERYIMTRQESAILPRDADDWKFIKELDPHMPFDCTSKTRLIFQRLCTNDEYHNEIKRVLNRSLGYPEFDCLVLDELIGESNIVS